ncbi:MAG TPA: glycosyltransferase family 4 protein [bacterium]|nr:glycosyltransferase family 4 protein [bacterium]
MSRLWIFNHYAEPPDRQATRSFDLGRELVRRGHEVTIFSASFSHYRFREEKLGPGEDRKTEEVEGVRFVWLRTTPYRENDWRRLLNMLSYMWRAARAGAGMRPGPDVVIGVTVHPFAALAALLVARRRRARFFFEVTDLWPRTLTEFGLLPARHPAVWALGVLERFLFRRAERVISLLPHIDVYLRELGLDPGKVVWIPNGVDLARYEILRGYDGRPHDPFTVMYVGGLVQANALEVVLDAARTLQDRGENHVRFVFVGGGQEQGRLAERARGLRNVHFHGVVPKDELPKVMAQADAFVFSLRNLTLYRYGISLNKMCDYLASGRPILFAGTSSYDPITSASAGIRVPPEDPRALADAVSALRGLPPEARARMGKNGVAYVREYHDIRGLAARLEALF